jgi:hypothetical protein
MAQLPVLNIPASQFGFYKRMPNPAESILDKLCTKRRLKVGELYDLLVEWDAGALADEYL